ncbi:HD domain-containing protein [Chloroflexota bacterium]
MAIGKGLILKIFSAASIQRWNDRLRPMELTELDKQAHKMIIAYVLGKINEDNTNFTWQELIENGIFEFLQRVELTDMKPPILYKIKEHKGEYDQLKKWMYGRLSPVIELVKGNFAARLQDYFENGERSFPAKIIGAAHIYATQFEFDIISRINPMDSEMGEIKNDILSRRQKYSELQGTNQLESDIGLAKFISLCGQLRFQLRWGNINRVTTTSVLGHMLIVAILAYLFSLEIGASPKRCANNFFTGLFHDLPEVLTRDIISPVKGSVEGISGIVKEYEKEQMKEKIYSIIPKGWQGEMKVFTEEEFANIVTLEGKTISVNSEDMDEYNQDHFNPRDGSLIKACDALAAFVEAYLALRNGMTVETLHEAVYEIKAEYKNKIIAGINFGQIYADFDL